MVRFGYVRKIWSVQRHPWGKWAGQCVVPGKHEQGLLVLCKMGKTADSTKWGQQCCTWGMRFKGCPGSTGPTNTSANMRIASENSPKKGPWGHHSLAQDHGSFMLSAQTKARVLGK